MLKLIGGLALLAIVTLLIVAATRPSSFLVQRSITINAPSDKVAALINNFHNWAAWSPWAKMDPNMKTTYSGASSGSGAVYEWEGNNKVGTGRMEILSTASSKTSIKLDFLKPFAGHNIADFLLEPQGSATKVTWVMYGPSDFFPGKIMSVFVSMDKMIGGDFEKGLANLKSTAEK